MEGKDASVPTAFPEGLDVPSKISSNVLGARSDSELGLALLAGRAGSVIVNYGSSWCAHCHELFPHFYDLAKMCARNTIGPWHLLRVVHDTGYDMNIRSDGIDITASRFRMGCHRLPKDEGSWSNPKHPQHKYVVAQVDYMKDALQGVKVTPTFAVFNKGRKVDQFIGPSPQQLRDRVWLHSDDANDC